MNEQEVPQSLNRSASRSRFLAKAQRYWSLLSSKGWWVMPIGIGLGLVAMVINQKLLQDDVYTSYGKMIVSIKLSIPEGSVYTEELSNFLGTQAALMQSGVVINNAHEAVLAKNSKLPQSFVSLKVSVAPKTSIFHLQATSTNAPYAQAFLQECMEQYVKLKREMRAKTSDTTVAGLTEEVLKLEKELRKTDQELVEFQSTNSIVLLQEQGNSAGNYLSVLNTRLAGLRSEYDLLQSLTLEQNLERRQQVSGALPTDPGDHSPVAAMDADYMKAKQQIILLKAEQQDLGQYLRPKHPKMVALTEEIARRERLLDIFRQQSSEQLESRKGSIALQIRTLEKDVKEWDAKALDVSRKSAEFQRLKSNAQRVQGLYEQLLRTMQTLDVNKDISPESVTIMEQASRPKLDVPEPKKQYLLGAIAGLVFALMILLFLDRLDDRMASTTELQEHFEENVLAQIPRERAAGKGSVPLIEVKDERHSFVEAYRNLRSSLLFLNEQGDRPKTILVTSSIPGEGKSLTSANLALTLARSGSKVLLVDADLRKGTLHDRFGLDSEPGVTEMFEEGIPWRQVVRATKYPNLSFIPRGATSQRSSEYFLGPLTPVFLRETSAEYDVVMIDTAPVMAADDVTSLAPLVDGVVFVIRAEHTSARVARAALDALYQRQVDVLGLVFNAVRPTSSDYYYYYKYKDYYAQTTSDGARKRRKHSHGHSRGHNESDGASTERDSQPAAVDARPEGK